MGSFGERLRREREMRGITLDEIAAATKIGTRNLKALEDEEFGKLPGGIFNKGFVRAYAKFLGINEEQAVADFLTASGESETSIDPSQLLAQHEDVDKISKSASRKAKDLQSIQVDSPSGFPWVAIVGLILLVAIAYGGRAGYFKYKAYKEAQEQAQRDAQVQAQREAQAKAEAAAAAARAAQQVANPTDGQAQGTPSTPTVPGGNVTVPEATPTTPKPESNAAPPSKPSSAGNTAQITPSPGNFVVSIRARQNTWISITADGKHVMAGELGASSQKIVQARNRITLKTGNAGGMDVAFNGKNIPSMGAEGQVRTITISADGTIQ